MPATSATVALEEKPGVETRDGRWPASITEYRGGAGLQGLNRNGTVVTAESAERFRAIRHFVPLAHAEIGSQRATPHSGLYNNPRHRPSLADAFALSLVLSGRIDARNGGVASRLSGTAVNLFSMGNSSSYVARGPSHLVTVQVPSERIDPLAARWLQRPSTARSVPSSLSNASHAFIASILADPPAEGGRAAHQLERTMVQVIDALIFEAKDAQAAADPTPSMLYALVEEAVEEGAHRVDFSLREVAAAVAMDERRLQAILRAHGTGFARLLADIRVRRLADRLDRASTATITGLIAEVGFADADSGSRAFRTRFGSSPSAYRARATLHA